MKENEKTKELDDLLDELYGDHICPCGCNNDVNFCAYASVCVRCKNKYYGGGYAIRGKLCPDCEAVGQGDK